MTNVLIRGLSDKAVERIDAEAAELGLSRHEFLRRKLEGGDVPRSSVTVTAEDWNRSAEVFQDLGDPSVMGTAWQ
ncbi:Ribbon-helix-helix protein, copG family [Micrococcales bacterium KH10]|nr:Ribbon-helix-helix protein, copG family [Micrococcales bacterium KH10]